MDPDMNKYDLEHVCTAHPLMSKDDVGAASIATPGRATTPTSMSRRCMRRARRERHQPQQDARCDDRVLGRGADRGRASAAVRLSCAARCARSAAHGMPIVNPLVFYPWRALRLRCARPANGARECCAIGASSSAWRPIRPPAPISTRRMQPVDAGDSPIISSRSLPTRSRRPTARRPPLTPPRHVAEAAQPAMAK